MEDAARRVPSVDDAAALIRESDVTGEVIDLFYTGDAGENRKTIQAIRSGLLGLLPTHHALGTIKRVDALPRNQSGKLLRSELRRL